MLEYFKAYESQLILIYLEIKAIVLQTNTLNF